MTDKNWGMRFNGRPDYQRFNKTQKVAGCPEWLESHQISIWQEQGLVIWNNIDKRIVALKGQEALRLLDQLNSQSNWRSEGVSITCQVIKIEMGASLRGRRKKTEEEPKVETTVPKPTLEEILHLPPEAGPEIIELLQTNKTVISEMADWEKKQFQEAMRQFWEHVLEFSHKKELSEFDFQARPFKWQNLDTNRWICRLHSAEGRICLLKNNISWHACVKREGYAEKSDYSFQLLKAVDWVEKELVDLANQPDLPTPSPRIHSEQQIKADHLRLKKKLADGPYWIDPAVLEPVQVTYKLFIEVVTKPIDFKTFESICGDTLRYDERYLSPLKLANTLNLDIDHFNIDQPAGENSDWYRVTSLTRYYQERSAAEQAQNAWDQSKILHQFKEGKIGRARYGYREEETGYVVHLGACGESGDPWEQHITRNEYLELQALRESLCFALDVNDYRDYLGVSDGLLDDEKVLHTMHRTRAHSKHLSEEIKRESKTWLVQHEPIE